MRLNLIGRVVYWLDKMTVADVRNLEFIDLIEVSFDRMIVKMDNENERKFRLLQFVDNFLKS